MKSLYKKYLHNDYLKKIQNSCMSPHDTNQMLKKYNNILRIISTYIPQNIVISKIRNVEDKTHSGNFVEGTLLFADVSGFTALTEKLSSQGYEGSEEITRILNNFFMVMVEVILQYGGILLKYGGDAMMIYFSTDDDFCGKDHVYHAVSCANEMRNAMSNFSLIESKFGSFSLQMSMSVHTNTFFETIVGDPSIHCEYFLTGAGVEETAILEGKTGKGEILLDKNTYTKIKDHVNGFSLKENCYLIEAFNSKKMPTVTKSKFSIDYDNIDDILKRLDALLNFVMRGVYDKVKLSWKSLVLEGEYRPVTIVFLNFYFLRDLHKDFEYTNEETIQSIYNEYFLMVQKNVEHHDGTINKIDMYDKGDKIIIIFGFPQSHADDEKRAVKCMNSILEEGKKFIKRKVKDVEFTIHQKIGIHSGFIFCGNVGSPLRQEYTIIGDSVNLSARLMSAAKDNQMLITDSILKETSNIVTIEYSEKKTFKGKSNKIPVHAVESVRDRGTVKVEFFIGRNKELDILEKQLHESSDKFNAIQIVGPAGMGKSFLIQEFLRNNIVDHEIIAGRGLPIGSAVQFHTIKEMLMLIFGIISKDNDDTIKEKINKLISYLKLENLAFSIPLIGVLLSKAYKNEAVLEIEDPTEKKELFFSTFYQIIKAKCELSPCILLCEDGEWLDKKSIETLNYLVKRRVKNLFIIVLTRKELPFQGTMKTLNLKPFNENEVNDFIDQYPHLADIPAKVQKQIQEKSRGVPYFIFELLNSIRDRGVNSRLPDSIYKSILSRLDEMGEENKDLIKKASVFGISFKQDLLQKLTEDKIDIESIIKKIITEDYIMKSGTDEYIFRNMMVQEVTYNLLSVKKRKKLHSTIAAIIEKEGDITPYYEILAYHYEKSEVYDKAIYYFEKSGDKAVQLNNYPNAIEFFDMALSLMVHSKKKETYSKTEADILGKKGNVLISIGEFSKAQKAFTQSKKIAKEYGLDDEIAFAEINLAEIYLKKGNFKKAHTTFNQSITLYKKINNNNQLGKCYLNLGIVKKLTGESKNAFEYFEESIAYYEQENNISGIADVYTNRGNLAKELSDFDYALESYNNAMELYNEIDHEFGKASILNNIGTLYNSLGKYKEAIKHFKESQYIEEKIGNEKGTVVCLNNLGNSYSLLRDWDVADDYFIQGLEIANQVKNPEDLANIYLNRGVMYMYKEEYVMAKDLILKAVEYFSVVKDGHGLYTSFYNLGLIFQKQNDIDKSLEYFNKALNEAKLLDTKIYIKAALNISLNYYTVNKIKRALELVTAAISASENISYYSLSAELYQAAAKYHTALKENEQAIEYLQQSQQLWHQHSEEKSAAYTGIQLAQLYLENNDIEKAKEELNKSLLFFDSSNDIVGKIYSQTKIASLYEGINDIESANSHYESSLNELEKIGFEQQLPYIYEKIALNYLKIDNLSKAISTLQKAIRIAEEQSSTDTAHCFFVLADIYYKIKNFSLAVEYYEKGFEQDFFTDTSQKEHAAYKIGTLYKNSGNAKTAIKYFELCAVSHDLPVKIIANKQLALIYDSIGDTVLLKQTLIEISDLEKNSEKKDLLKKCLNNF
ncbi:MAG: tetratricopeptide repeat protein [bacterium]|nr:tetratricopeptide repeat protein [bacterium]